MTIKNPSVFLQKLIENSLIEKQKALDLQKRASIENVSFLNLLLNEAVVEEKRLISLLSEEYSCPAMDLDSFDFSLTPKNLDEKLIREHKMVPIYQNANNIFIVMIDPGNARAIKEFSFSTGKVVNPVLAEPKKIQKAIERLLDKQHHHIENLEHLANSDSQSLYFNINDYVDSNNKQAKSSANKTSIIELVNKILVSAVQKQSSDIHFEPYEKKFRIRFRTDGILHEVTSAPLALAAQITSRLKIMSGMDIAERRMPQDGRIKIRLSQTSNMDFRVNSLPTLWGEKIVLRILDASSAQMGIDALGYEEDQKKLYLEALHKPQGMILVTGPTGSGKTVSLYTGINILNTSEINISTVEDPVEINLEGINQVNVNSKQGLEFSSALRAFLRQDPDVLMVGEIRDLETANIAIKAAQTGHMVMSTLHTNSAVETILRLLNMGVAPFNLATSINLIIAQRLARKLCPKCKHTQKIPERTLEQMGYTPQDIKTGRFYAPKGCSACNNGYKGRVGIYEVVKITPNISRSIMEGKNAAEILEIAKKEGFLTLRMSGLQKARAGLTSLEEINRVTLE